MNFKKYRRTGLTEMRPYVPGESMEGISVGDDAISKGSPKEGDMIARNPSDHGDQWLVTKEFIESTGFEEVAS